MLARTLLEVKPEKQEIAKKHAIGARKKHKMGPKNGQEISGHLCHRFRYFCYSFYLTEERIARTLLTKRQAKNAVLVEQVLDFSQACFCYLVKGTGNRGFSPTTNKTRLHQTKLEIKKKTR